LIRRTTIRAAGAVVWRRSGDGGLEIAVVHRPKYDDWTLPKGKRDGNETDPETAEREVAEETGLTGELGADLGTVDYVSRDGPKTVRYYAMQATGGTFASNREVDELRWVSPDAAKGLLTYARDSAVLDRFLTVPH
jgi:8-oxo-dGTP diphosphatase